MNPIFISAGTTVIYYSGVIIALAVAACFAISISLYTSYAGNGRAMWLLLPIAVVLSLFFCRLIHWYCHAEQYKSIFGALLNYSGGGYVLPGAVFGTWLAAVIVEKLGFTDNAPRLLDAVAPGGALCVALIRLSALFNGSCRSKIAVENPLLQRLPFASQGSDGSYRFATFFVQFIIMLAVFLALYRFCCRSRSQPMKGDIGEDGHVARMFLLLHSAVELIMDSLRNDSSYMHFNGFVSIVQMIAALSILGLVIYYSVWSIRINGRRPLHFICWIVWFASLAGVGLSEYFVQRHGDWYIRCYAIMAVSLVVMCYTVIRLYRSCCKAIRRE
ncbi:MAG: hypothetical protein Q4E35_02555 [Eubacteriales bacterium]|nr:hypothetical protein [Eubacteriales bacterium]